MAQTVKCTGDTIVSPAAILTSHADDEFGDLRSDGRTTRIEAVLRAVELLSDQLTKPGQDGVWLGGRGHWLESATSESFADDG
jgi:hypothetical protein